MRTDSERGVVLFFFFFRLRSSNFSCPIDQSKTGDRRASVGVEVLPAREGGRGCGAADLPPQEESRHGEVALPRRRRHSLGQAGIFCLRSLVSEHQPALKYRVEADQEQKVLIWEFEPPRKTLTF